MSRLRPITAVTFDVGQTLTCLDTAALVQRVRTMGAGIDPDAVESTLPKAWQAYDDVVRRRAATVPWKVFMSTLLDGGGIAAEQRDGVVEQLWAEQPHRNLWRRPVEGMIEVVDELRRSGLRVAIVSNSEGRVAELLDELGWLGRFAAVADSGRLGFEKPDPRIFRWACDALGVRPEEAVHVGDSRSADVEGALGAGMRAIWFGGESDGLPPDRARSCREPGQILDALRGWGWSRAGPADSV